MRPDRLLANITNKDIRAIYKRLKYMKRNGRINLKCQILLCMIAEEIGEVKEDEDCLNHQMYHNLIAEEIDQQDEVMAQEEQTRMGQEQERLIAQKILEEEEAQTYQDNLYRQAHEELIAEEVAEQEEILAEEAERGEDPYLLLQENLIAEDDHWLDAGFAWICQDIDAEYRMLVEEENWQAYCHAVREEIAEQDEVLAQEERIRRDLMHDQEVEGMIADEILAEEEAQTRQDSLFRQAREELIAEEIAELEEALKEAEGWEEARWQHQERLVAEDELAQNACKDGESSIVGEWGNDAVASYIEQIGQDQQKRRFLCKKKRKVKMVNGFSIPGSVCTATTMDDESVGQGRARKRRRKSIRESLRLALTEIFNTEAQQRNWEMNRHARYAMEDEILEDLAHQDWLDTQDRDEMLADAEEAAQLREQEIAEQDEVLSEQARQESLYEKEQERLIGQEGYAGYAMLETCDIAAIRAGAWDRPSHAWYYRDFMPWGHW
eukprot:CAMPEP_0181130094 /NCGR_PEP_ID=MMETSP1071-20121207/29674_1 /TAXON_ID=35127 /ORGANISM="Thalassiosira sp., Strain NH16" /LENGTH=493 /DNA_ID=CAMNT_0023216129 /DNA_START=66 /DNA_END=1544 /DNA_ORIENTATION=-